MSSLIVFSVEVGRLATLYERVLGLSPRVEPWGDIRLVSDRDEILIHSVPDELARTLAIDSPPAPRDGSPIKPVFEVDSLASALDIVRDAGGVVTGHRFVFEGATGHDVLDPDGNVIQLRGATP